MKLGKLFEPGMPPATQGVIIIPITRKKAPWAKLSSSSRRKNKNRSGAPSNSSNAKQQKNKTQGRRRTI